MPSESRGEWRPLNPTNVKGLRGRRILAVRADGKGYYGEIVDITPEYITLSNGSQWQLLRFHDSPTQFAPIEPPKPKAPRLAERQFNWKDNGNGRGQQ
jgi:hypothetical protein